MRGNLEGASLLGNSSEVQFFRGVMSMGAGSLATLFFGFVGLTVGARIIPQEDFGVSFLIFTIVYVAEVIGSLGLRPSAAKFLAGAPSDAERQALVNNLLTFKVLTVLLASLLVIVGKPVFLHFFSSELLSSLFIYVPVLFAFQSIELMLESIMQGFQLYGKMASVRILTSALNCGLVLLFVLLMHLGVKGYLQANILALFFAGVLRYWMIPGRKGFAFDWNVVWRLIRFGLPLQGNDILGSISQRLDMMILGAIAAPAAVAYLGVARRIPEILLRLFNSLYLVYFPYTSDLFSRGRHLKAEEVLNRVLRLTSFVTMFGALTVVLFEAEIVVCLFSEKYLPCAPALGVLMIVFAISVASMILDYTLISAGHPGYLLAISLADTIPSILANLTLIPALGVMGAVYAKLIANIICNPVSVWCVRREKIGVKVSGYLKPMGFLVACLGIHFGLGQDTIVLKGLLMVLFVVLCVNFSVVSWRDVADLLRGLRRPIQSPVLGKD
jgi:O-antigen/teichoic acid export membrane protein